MPRRQSEEKESIMKVMFNDHDMLEEYDLIHSVINNCAYSAVGY
jgi:hypothetical protein